eukprot:comp21863_c0_seq1/m.49480 comp21863_c0_seq1/g.49480  ORF comp21863_c0_seq1/g.49480 comp21863_c0_seq1/m.49480 type:complete len:323 (-) comp21863_c0_seq1:829-1797(-)
MPAAPVPRALSISLSAFSSYFICSMSHSMRAFSRSFSSASSSACLISVACRSARAIAFSAASSADMASLHSCLTSAGVQRSSGSLATVSSVSFCSKYCSIRYLSPAPSQRVNSISMSMRPGRRNAGSNSDGSVLVVHTQRWPVRSFTPSSRVRMSLSARALSLGPSEESDFISSLRSSSSLNFFLAPPAVEPATLALSSPMVLCDDERFMAGGFLGSKSCLRLRKTLEALLASKSSKMRMRDESGILWPFTISSKSARARMSPLLIFSNEITKMCAMSPRFRLSFTSALISEVLPHPGLPYSRHENVYGSPRRSYSLRFSRK